MPAKIFAHEKLASTSRLQIALLISLFFHLALIVKYGQFNPGISSSAGLQITLTQAPVAARAETSPSDDVAVPRRQAIRPAERARTSRKPPDLAPSPPAPPTPASTPAPPAERKEAAIGVPLPGMTGRVSCAVISFDVFSGADRQLIASGQHLYVADRDDNFGISIKQVPDSVDAQGQWHIEISGKISRQGLAPFLYETAGDLARRLMSAEAGSVRSGGSQIRRMPDGIIDRQSLMYYFMFKPPELTGGKVLLSDGASYAPFSYRVAGIESLPIAARGQVPTLKLVFTTGESSETIELWVVPDLHYLPVKARYTDRQGLVTELAATSLEFD